VDVKPVSWIADKNQNLNFRFGPPEVELFSASGCRGVSQRVDQILEESDFNSLTTNIRQK
jgi:hypothetical protein